MGNPCPVFTHDASHSTLFCDSQMARGMGGVGGIGTIDLTQASLLRALAHRSSSFLANYPCDNPSASCRTQMLQLVGNLAGLGAPGGGFGGAFRHRLRTFLLRPPRRRVPRSSCFRLR